MHGVSPLKVDGTLFSQYFALLFLSYNIGAQFQFQFCFILHFFIFTVLEELLNQYLMGGKEPSRRDLDHVFLRFGRKDLQFSFFGIKLRFYFYFIFYSFQFFMEFVFFCVFYFDLFFQRFLLLFRFERLVLGGYDTQLIRFLVV